MNNFGNLLIGLIGSCRCSFNCLHISCKVDENEIDDVKDVNSLVTTCA